MRHENLQAQEVSFDLADLFAFFWYRKWVIGLTAAVLIGAGYSYVSSLPKRYAATSTLLLGEEGNSSPLSGVAALAGNRGGRMDTHIEFIRSRSFLSQIAEQLELQNLTEFQPLIGPLKGQPSPDHAVAVLQEDLSLSVVANTDLLKVTYLAREPKLAAQIVNAIGPAFFDYQSGREQQRAANASQWLNQQIEAASNSLDGAELRLQQFLEQNQLVDVKSEMVLLQSEIVALMREKMLAEKQLSELQASLNQLSNAGDNTAAMLQVPWVAANDFVKLLRGQIQRQQQQFSELTRRYKPKHYKYIAARSSLDNVEKELADTLIQLRTGMEEQRGAVIKRIQGLEGQIAEARNKHSDMGNLEMQLTRLKREVEITQHQYDALLSRLQEAEVLQDMGNTQNFAVVDEAKVPDRPVSPKMGVALVVISILSLAASSGLWLIVHLFRDKPTRYRHALARQNIPVLAEVPRSTRFAGSRLLGSRHSPAAVDYDEAIRTLRTSLIMLSHNGNRRRILFSHVGAAGGRGENKLVTSLAQAFAQLEKVLLVEANLRSPSLVKHYGLSDDQPGLTELLNRQAKFSQCIYRPQGSKLSVLSAGQVPQDPVATLSKPELKWLFGKFASAFERVIVSSPSLTEVSDSLVLSNVTDGVVLMCNLEKTEMVEVQAAIAQFRDSGVNIIGVVFDGVKLIGRRKARRFNFASRSN